MKLGISLAVHENWDVVQDQLLNIETFAPGATVALHVSRSFGEPVPPSLFHPRLLINPERFATSWGSGFLLKVHLSQFQLLEREGIHTFLMAASNELLVRSGLERYLAKYDAGVERFLLDPAQPGKWEFQTECLNDPVFQELRRHSGLKKIYCSSVEGSFYRSRVFAALRDRLNTVEIPTLGYPQEEAYFATLSQDLITRRAKPVCYLNFASALTIVPEDIAQIRKTGKGRPLRSRASLLTRLKIWAGEIRNRVGKEKFSVKRIPREMGDPLRIFLRSLAEKHRSGRESRRPAKATDPFLRTYS